MSSLAPYHHIKAITQTFIAPSEMKSLAITTSKYGVTSKELVCERLSCSSAYVLTRLVITIDVNGQNQIASIPRRLLDPRRPTAKPTKADKEEMLIQYDPFVGPEPKRVISHKYEVSLRYTTE
jgi:hypothetical protein